MSAKVIHVRLVRLNINQRKSSALEWKKRIVCERPLTLKHSDAIIKPCYSHLHDTFIQVSSSGFRLSLVQNDLNSTWRVNYPFSLENTPHYVNKQLVFSNRLCLFVCQESPAGLRPVHLKHTRRSELTKPLRTQYKTHRLQLYVKDLRRNPVLRLSGSCAHKHKETIHALLLFWVGRRSPTVINILLCLKPFVFVTNW